LIIVGVLVSALLTTTPAYIFAQCAPEAPWERQTPAYVGTPLNDIWGDGTYLYAVGDDGAALVYDGIGWSEMESGTPMHLRAIFGTGPANIWSVGDNGTIIHYDSLLWSPSPSGTDYRLHGIWADPAGGALAVGGNGLVLIHDGNAWTPDSLGALLTFTDVWGTSMQNVYAVGHELDVALGTYSGVAYRYDGSGWNEVFFLMGSGRTVAVWGAGPSEIYMMTAAGVLLTYGGTPATGAHGVGNGAGIWGRSPTDIVLVGNLGGTGYLSRGFSTTWEPAWLHEAYNPSGVWGDASGDIHVVDRWGSVFRFDGSAWETLRGGAPTQDLYAVHGSGPDDVYAVGDQSVIQHYDGVGWKIFETPPPTFYPLYSVFAFSSDDVMFGGAWGDVFHWQGGSWTTIPNPLIGSWASVAALWGSSSSDVYACMGGQSQVYRYNGSAWSRLSSDYLCADVWGSGANNVYFADVYENVLHYDGDSLRTVLDTGEHMYGVSGNGPNNVWAVGSSGTVVHYDGSGWESVGGPSGRLHSVYVSAEGVVYTCNDNNAYDGTAIFWYDGGVWTPIDTPPPPEHTNYYQRYALWGGDDCSVFAVGSAGIVLRTQGGRTPVLIQDFHAVPFGEGVELAWRTWSDEYLAGFRVYRRDITDAALRLLAGTASLPPGSERFVDRGVEAGESYDYMLAAVGEDGTETRSQEITATAPEVHISSPELFRSHPNPFQSTTTVRFRGVPGARTALRVYDVAGREVATLWAGRSNSDIRSIEWNGTDSAGNRVGSGIYFYRLTSGKQVITKKITLLK